jgi:hypothetical protein
MRMKVTEKTPHLVLLPKFLHVHTWKKTAKTTKGFVEIWKMTIIITKHHAYSHTFTLLLFRIPAQCMKALYCM